MKVKFTLEEIISQEFEADVSSLENAYDEIRQQYKDGKLVLENPTVTQVNVLIGTDSSWIDLHI